MKKFLNRIGSPLRKDRKKKEKDSKSSEKRKNRLRAKTSGMALGVLGAKYFYKNSKSEKPLTPGLIDVVRLATESANGSGFKGLSQPTQQQLLLGQLMGLQSSLALFYRNAKRKSTR